MSKLNQIQDAIPRLGAGAYQKLMDSYIVKKYGFNNIYPLGSHTGTDKTTKGTPDSFVKLDDGRFVLIAHGSVRDNAFKKVEITVEASNNLLSVIHNKPIAESGYDYQLRSDTLEWELYKLPLVEEQQGYTKEQLLGMTADKLKAICAEMGISGSMTKANIVALILSKQAENI